MVCLEDQYFNVNRILLLTIGLWPYEQSKFTQFQVILFSGILLTSIIFQVKNYFNKNLFACLIIIIIKYNYDNEDIILSIIILSIKLISLHSSIIINLNIFFSLLCI